MASASKPRPLSVKLAALVFALAGTVVACGMSSAESAFLAGRDQGGPANADTIGEGDASGGGVSPTPPPRLASPLCPEGSVDGGRGTCSPDSEDMCSTSFVPRDAGVATDGSPGDGGASMPTEACRVTIDSTNAKIVSCKPAGQGRDGAACQKSSDCASGYDCSSEGVCRHYCCDGRCESVAQNGAKTFCDVQQLREATATKVPLCMPIRDCTLFSTTDCKQGETCSVVNSAGATACVATGSAGVDQSCEDTHCQAGLVCLGVVGQRKCEQLCHLNSYDCKSPSHPRCEGSSYFPQGFGICK
jgi:hypothetical protein